MVRDDELIFNEENASAYSKEEIARSKQGVDDPATELLRLIDFLENTLSNGRSFTRTKLIVDSDKVYSILDNMRGNIPEAIQYAQQIMEERENMLAKAQRTINTRINNANALAESTQKQAESLADEMIAKAKEEAAQIIAQAAEERASMIEESSVTQAAQEEARDIISQAKADANQIRLDAASYGNELLKSVERELQKAVDMVHNRRETLDDIR